MASKLTIGSTIQLYTNYETISGTKVKVVAVLAYSEIAKQTFNITALAINERVISVSDEDLESLIEKSGDQIYLCRAIEANADGSNSEYVVWDSIINAEKTKIISNTYTYNLNIKLLDTTSVPISQIISGIEKYVKNNFSTSIDFSIDESNCGNQTVASNDKITDSQLDKVSAILTTISNFETRLIPAAEKITSLNLSENMDDVSTKLDKIAKNINIIAQQI
jgi:hypothetical protein